MALGARRGDKLNEVAELVRLGAGPDARVPDSTAGSGTPRRAAPPVPGEARYSCLCTTPACMKTWLVVQAPIG